MSAELSWKTAHSILLVIGFVVASTVGALNFFAWASDMKELKNDINITMLEQQAGNAQDRIIVLEKEVGKKSLSTSEKVDKNADKHKWEMQLDYLNKKIEYYQGKGGN